MAAVQPPEGTVEEDKKMSTQLDVPLELRVLILKKLSMSDVKVGEIILPRKAVEEKQRDLFPPDIAGYVRYSL